LVISYVYGLWRLHRLGGPGVDEFVGGVEPPWKAQTKGFYRNIKNPGILIETGIF